MKRFLLLLIVIATPLLHAAAQPRFAFFGNTKYIHLADIVRLYGMRMIKSNGVFNCYYGRMLKMKLRPKAVQININGVNVSLADPVMERNKMPYISAADWNKTIRILLNPRRTTRPHRIATVVIDPGHGGNDRGASGLRSQEKILTLRIAKRVAAILRQNRYRVIMTRQSDVKLPLERRPHIANVSQGDIFVSIHLNAAKDKSVHGIETFALTPAGMASTNDRSRKKASSPAHPGNSFDANNLLLAAVIQSNLVRTTAAHDRGVKRARFAVLRDLKMPGVLIETGFISNRQEENRLITDAYINKVALAIVKGIIQYRKTIPAGR